MPRFTKNDVTVETAVPTEIVALRSQGFTEQNGESLALDEGGSLPSGLSVITNDTARAEVAKPTPKTSK